MKRNTSGFALSCGLPARQYRRTCFRDAFVFIDRAAAHADAADDENAIKLANAEVNPALEQAAVWDELGHLGGNVIEAEYAVLPKTGTDDEIVLFEADM